MIHSLATLAFLFSGLFAGAVIWAMLADNRAAISAALGLAPMAVRVAPAARRVRVKAVRPAAAFRSPAARRAA